MTSTVKFSNYDSLQNLPTFLEAGGHRTLGETLLDRVAQFDENGVWVNDGEFDEYGRPILFPSYGFDDEGNFTVLENNRAMDIIVRWENWGSIGDRVICVQILIDLSGSQQGHEGELRLAMQSTVKGLQGKGYDFAHATWIRFAGFDTERYYVLLDWSPLKDIDPETIPAVQVGGGTPTSTALMFLNQDMRDFAAATRAHTGLKPVMCNLVCFDGSEAHDFRYRPPFNAGHVAEAFGVREFVDDDKRIPLMHAMHNTILFVGGAHLIPKCDAYAAEANFGFEWLKALTAKALAKWFIDKIHTASAVGSDDEEETEAGVIDFAAEADAEFDADVEADVEAASSGRDEG